MAVVLDLVSKTAVQIVVSVTGQGAATFCQVQISDHENMLFGLIVSGDIAITGGNMTLNGLNQSSRYFIRARERISVGVYGDWSPVIGVVTDFASAQSFPVGQLLLDTALLVIPEPIFSHGGYAALAGYPKENVTIDDPNAECWVPYGGSGDVVMIFGTAGGPVDTFSVLGTNCPYEMNMRWRGYSSMASAEAGGVAGFDSGTMLFRASANLPQRKGYHSLYRAPSPQNYRFWRIDMGNVTGMLNTLVVGNVVIGLARKTKNISADKIETPIDLGSAERNRDGTIDRRYGHRGRKVDFEISFLRETQFQTEYADLWHRVGNTSPVLVVPNSKANAFLHDRILYGILSQSRTQNPRAPFYSQSFSCESIY